MKAWLDYFGYQTEQLPLDATFYFYFANLPKSVSGLIFVIVIFSFIVLMYKMYKKEHEACPAGVKKILGITRSILFILVVLIFLEPSVGVKIKKILIPDLLFFFDDSSSMTIKENFDIGDDQKRLLEVSEKKIEKTRVEVEKGILKKIMLDETALSEKGNSVFYSISNNSKVYEKAQGLLDNLNGEGAVSNLSGSLMSAIEDKQNKEIGAAVIVSDGQMNNGPSFLALESLLKKKKIPLYVVGVGKPERPKNLTVLKMVNPERVFKDDPFLISCIVKNSGYLTKEFKVGLYRRAKDAKETENELIEEKNVIIENDEEKFIQFEVSPKTEGAFKYSIKIPVESEEIISADNEMESAVDVMTQKAKVLLICGSSSWEYRFLNILLKRDKTIELSSWLQSIESSMANEGDVVLTKLPSSKEELFAYDVILLLDPNPIEFDEDWINNLKLFLEEKNGGLLYKAGPKYTSKFVNSNQTKSIVTLLPVLFPDYQKENTDFLNISFKKEWPIDLTTEGQANYMLKFHQDEVINLKIWKNLPGIYWSFPALKEKPGSRLLIEHPDPKLQTKSSPRPLLVSGQYGLGKTCYMGFTGTWRWRKLGEEYHEKFWIQMVRYLMEGKLEKNGGMSAITIYKNKLTQGEEIRLSTKIYDLNKQLYTGDKIELKVFKSDILVDTFELKKDVNLPGVYEGKWKAKTSGKLQLVLDGDGFEKVVKNLDVEAPMVEFYQSELNETSLKSLALHTGGRYYLPSEYEALLKDLPNKKKTVVRNLSPILLWDHKYIFCLLLLLLTFEWVLRKKYKLL